MTHAQSSGDAGEVGAQALREWEVGVLQIFIFNQPGTFRNTHTGGHEAGEVNEGL